MSAYRRAHLRQYLTGSSRPDHNQQRQTRHSARTPGFAKSDSVSAPRRGGGTPGQRHRRGVRGEFPTSPSSHSQSPAVWPIPMDSAPSAVGRTATARGAGGVRLVDEWLYLLSGQVRLILADHDITMGRPRRKSLSSIPRDGVQAAFYNDPRIADRSIHESPLTLFPGAGWPHGLRPRRGGGYVGHAALPSSSCSGRSQCWRSGRGSDA